VKEGLKAPLHDPILQPLLIGAFLAFLCITAGGARGASGATLPRNPARTPRVLGS
jgi:hypothetical protein